MEVLKLATDWARAEVFSARFFILFSILFLSASIGFWQLGKTEMAKAYVIPTLVAGFLILAVGIGIFFTNKGRISSFEEAYNQNPTEFVKTEIARSDKTIKEFSNIVFKVIPLIILVASLVLVFINSPMWRAISITTIALMVAILYVDSNADARIKEYKSELQKSDYNQNANP